MALSNPNTPELPTPFDLENDALYRQWKEWKLAYYPTGLGDLVVEIGDPRELTQGQFDALHQRCRKANMAIYVGNTGDDPDPGIPLAVARRFGVSGIDRNWLGDESGLTSLKVVDEGVRQQYIPYTNRAIKWHTDGYYNSADKQIHALNLHCVQSAASGGENALMDHEIAYLLLRDRNPDYILALMAPDAMTIPARMQEDEVARKEEPGPVFSIMADGNLHMRYTIRTRNVVWRDDPLTREAVACLEEILDSDSPYIYRGRLEPGMGLVSNNILHDRAAFTDDENHHRLLYRARYYDRLKGTGIEVM
jgi:hypothetical protein